MLIKLRSAPVLMLIILAFACSKKQSVDQLAGEFLDEYRKLVDEQSYRKLGFESLDDFAKTSLGIPIPLYHIGLKDLKQFKVGDNPGKLLLRTSEIIYPVLVDGKIRSSLGMKKYGDSWEIASCGRPRLIRALGQIRDRHSESGGLLPSAYFAVEIPSMYLIFIGHRAGEMLMLTHVHDHDNFEFTAGETEPGLDVIEKIVDAAREYTGALASTP